MIRAVLAAVAASLVIIGCSSDEPGPTSSSTTTTAAPGPELRVVELDGRPADAVVVDGVVWIVDDDRDRIVRVGERTGEQVGAPIEVGEGPVAIDAGGSLLWVAHRDGFVTPVDSVSGEVEGTIDVGSASVDVAVAADGTPWVADIERSTVRSVDPLTREPGGEIAIPGGAVRMAFADAELWVSGLVDTVTAVDTSSGDVGSPVTVGNGPIGMAVVDGVLLVANADDDTISRVDTLTRERVGPDVAAGDAPVAVLARGSDVWVLDQDAGQLSRFDRRTLTGLVRSAPRPPRTTSLGLRPRAMTLGVAGPVVVGIDPSTVVLVDAV